MEQEQLLQQQLIQQQQLLQKQQLEQQQLLQKELQYLQMSNGRVMVGEPNIQELATNAENYQFSVVANSALVSFIP